MYYQNYEDYMQNILGYRNDMNQDTYNMPDDYYMMNNPGNQQANLENMYPEIYRIVYPMVNKACSMNTKPITEEVIEEITNSIFINIEANMESEVNVKMELRNGDVKNPNVKSEKSKETRAPNNTLRDLIRILVIRDLLRKPGRPQFPGGRPPFPGGPGMPGRPPFPGGPGMPPRPRDVRDYGMYY